MKHTNSKQGNIYDDNGNLICAATDEKDLRYFAVVLKCGHVGKEKSYIPIMFPIFGTKETLKERVKCMPRVKIGDKYHMLWSHEVSKLEFTFIKILNDVDPYLRSDALNDNNEIIKARCIDEPVLEEYNIGKRHIDREKHHKKRFDDDFDDDYDYHNSAPTYKYADEYDEQYVLQRCFAPKREASSYSKKAGYVYKDELLTEYMNQALINYAIPKKHEALLSLYYQIFGSVAPFYMEYQNGSLSYIKPNGELESLNLSDKIVEKLEADLTEQGIEQ